MKILMKEQGVSGRDSISGFVMHCRKRNEEAEMLRKMHRNWYLDRGLVFDLRAPNEFGERWDYTRRADRRLAWREMSKEEPLLLVMGESLSKRGDRRPRTHWE